MPMRKIMAAILAAAVLAAPLFAASEELPLPEAEDVKQEEQITLEETPEAAEENLPELAGTAGEVEPSAADVSQMSEDELVQAINNTKTSNDINALIKKMTEEQYQWVLANHKIDPMRYANNEKDRYAFSGMSDAQFFGKWDATVGKWAKGFEPQINYDYCDVYFERINEYRPLTEVEDAVKAANGDYAAARQAWLDYRRKAVVVRERPAGSSATNFRAVTELKVLENKFVYNPAVRLNGTLSVGNAPRWTSLDLEDGISNIMTTTNKNVTFYITAQRKDGSKAEFDSINKQGGNRPYLQVIENGQVKKFYPTNDATIKGDGMYEKTASKRPKHGLEDTLVAYEPPETINHNRLVVNGCNCDPQLVNENTSRILIKFELGDEVDANNTISSMTLNLYGRNAADTGDMDVVCVTSKENSDWEEATVDWRYNKDVKMLSDWDKETGFHNVMSYDGEQFFRFCKPDSTSRRYRDEFMRFTGTFDRFFAQYRRGGPDAESYGEQAIEQLYGYLLQMGNKTFHYDYIGGNRHSTNRLDLSFRPHLIGYTHNTMSCETMTPEFYTIITKYMIWVGDALCSGFTGGDGNWGGYEKSGAYRLSVELPELNKAPEWGKAAVDGIVETAEHYVRDDLACYESSLQYVYTALGTIKNLDTMARGAGFEAAEYPPIVDESRHNMYRYLLYFSGPGGRDHQQGDSATHMKTYYYPLSETEEFNDPELEWAAAKGQKGKPPAFTSIPFLQSKKFIMRSGWDDKAQFLISNADARYSHGHNDDLAISMFAYGQYLIADASYSGSNQTEPNKWMMSTQGHSTIIIDGANQVDNTAATGAYNAWGSNAHYDFVSLTTKANQKQGVTPTRNILFVKPGFWIVSDYMKPSSKTASHTYEQRWLLMPDAKPSVDPKTKIVRTNYANAANVQIVPVVPTQIKGYPTAEEFLEEGYMGGGTSVTATTKYVDFEQTDVKGNAVSNTILFPSNVNQEYEIKTEPLNVAGIRDGGATAFRMTHQEKKSPDITESHFYLVNDKAQKGTRTFGDYTFNGQMAYVAKKNATTLTDVIVRDYQGASNGLELKDNFMNRTLLKMTMPYEGLSVKYSNTTVAIETNVDISDDQKKDVKVRDIDLTKLTVYAPFAMERVTLNGNQVPFTQKGMYLYFGDSPIIDDPSPIPPTPSQGGGGTGAPAHGNGGGQPVVSPLPTTSPIPLSKLTPGMKEELSGHWAEKEITQMVEEGVVKGVSEQSLGLRQNVTRAEFVSLLVRTLGLEKVSYDGGFADVSADAWYADDLGTAKAYGFFKGDGVNANPDAQISRQEMAVMLGGVCEKKGIGEDGHNELTFADQGDVSDWAASGIRTAASAGLIKGMEDGSFKPLDSVPREQAIVVIYRLKQLENKSEK